MTSLRSTLVRVAGSLLGIGGLAAGITACGSASPAGAATKSTAQAASSSYRFLMLDDQHDVTFNQLLSINDEGVIAGYFGSGTPANVHPNRGYVLGAPYGHNNYRNENFPGSAQTQVTGINDSGTTTGFYADPAGDNFGFVLKQGVWTVVIDPHTTGTTNQLLGLNNNGVAVGFYTDSKGNSHAYEFNFHTDTFSAINIGGATSTVATGINIHGDVSGFYTNSKNDTLGFLRTANGHVTSFSVGGSSNTMPLGINNSDEIVGSWAASSTVTHGFVWRNGKATTVNDPNGVDSTVINGLNNKGDLVGFYTDSANNVDGFLATP